MRADLEVRGIKGDFLISKLGYGAKEDQFSGAEASFGRESEAWALRFPKSGSSLLRRGYGGRGSCRTPMAHYPFFRQVVIRPVI